MGGTVHGTFVGGANFKASGYSFAVDYSDPTKITLTALPAAAPIITSAAPPNGTLGVAYSHTFIATGNPTPTFSVSGTLPTGLTFDGVATISGTPTAPAPSPASPSPPLMVSRRMPPRPSPSSWRRQFQLSRLGR